MKITIKILNILSFIFMLGCLQSCHADKDSYITTDANGLGTYNGNPTDPSGEGYNEIVENPFINVAEEPVSTFSIDADGASYSNSRRFLSNSQLPPKDAIRTEELVNYFSFDYPEPTAGQPISLNGEISSCPWATGHKLLRIGIKGRSIAPENYPATNFVLLIDISGSMSSQNKLELLKESFNLFVEELRPQDQIAIVTYASNPSVLLESTSGSETNTIKAAINMLGSGGSTNGEGGMLKAYEIAAANFIPGGNNRIIMGTDGDFNVGLSSMDEMVELIEEKRETGVFLTIVGVGDGNLQDGLMEQIANNGNGNYEYIDNIEQAKKVFIHEFSNFFTVAKDVKIQIDFNPNVVQSYRLIGYENRLLNNEDFEDDNKDAGEIGAGQTITALYELVPAAIPSFTESALSVDFRYKLPDEDTSIPLVLNVNDNGLNFSDASENTRFAAAVAAFGLVMRDSDYKGTATYNDITGWASGATGFDPHAYREEFLQLVNIAEGL